MTFKRFANELTPDSSGDNSSHVFEVTNLEIPTGTDWSIEGYQLGTLELTSGKVGMVVNHYLKLAEPPADALEFDVFDVLNADYNWSAISGGGFNDFVPPASSALWTAQTKLVSVVQVSGPNALFPDPSVEIDWPISLPVGFTTNGPTTADITVVHARIALTVI